MNKRHEKNSSIRHDALRHEILHFIKHKEGLTIDVISDICGASHHTVRAWLRPADNASFRMVSKSSLRIIAKEFNYDLSNCENA